MKTNKVPCPLCQYGRTNNFTRKIWEDDFLFVLLSSHPATPGNIMVVPKEHHITIDSLSEKEKIRFFLTVLKFAEFITNRLKAKGYLLKYNNKVFLAEPEEKRHLAHIHFHIIPRYSVKDKVWKKPKAAKSFYFLKMQKILKNLVDKPSKAKQKIIVKRGRI